MKKIVIAFVVVLAFLQSSVVLAQDLLKSQDLSTLKVDYLTDAEVAKIKGQLQANNVTLEQAEPMALAKGMSAGEFAKLKTRLSSTTPTNTTVKKDSGDKKVALREQETYSNKKVKDTLNALVFGSELFDNPTLNFEPDLKLATPVNYVLGPGDELQVSVYGVQEYNASIPVSVEGKVTIQYVGQIPVSGLTIEAATQKIRAAIARVYSTVASGQSQVGVSLSRIRTIKVTIIGSKQPGNYSVSSLATVYNALYLGGGPSKNGSYRNIELIRNNKVYRNIDIYRFLVNGNQSDNIGLKDNDVIRIPAYTKRVTIEGEVKRPGIFELKTGESFSDVLRFASGFTDVAYTASVNVLQKTSKEFKVKDVKSSEFSSYKPLAGDVFKVTKILNRFENRIKIEGAVFRPDTYSYYKGMRISDLVTQADGLKEDAYRIRARIVRLKSDLTTEIVNVDLGKALLGDVLSNIELQKEDIVTVYSILDFQENYTVSIDGEIKKPGTYDYFENLSLNDVIVQAGGLTGAASKRVEIARMMKSEMEDVNNPNRVTLFDFEISAYSNEQLKNFQLHPYDVINIRRVAVYEKPQQVSVSGAVNYTGKYALVNKKEKIYDIIQRAGGLSSLADPNSVKIKRPIQAKQIEDLENINLNLGKKDSIQNKLEHKLKEELKFATIPVEWKSILKKPSSTSNITLLPGDEIEVSFLSESVKVTGNVLLTSEIPYERGRGFSYYLDAVGGTDAKAWRKKAYVIYPNGKAAVTGHFLFWRSYPKVLPGSQIVVPEKPATKKMTTGEWVSMGSVISSLALLIVTAFK
ncbi:protein involved in polysaccharide export, contains SLBB domain of the beta-grasp fold [Flavobacterium succinicans]|uniref:Protein involved in polysaccharide export, contains SLBB domain of the beta-grasp fold n=1 Tax=Flavobacterium succinicans TaxID=29536 RepID=A0A1I4SDA1_9FLAO|nr:SLBB domain-containing protein [Flavobacterium succinicans]SFM62447.1 protein involved in polysaccharide export, contains SLBB domain of the beta-grasp fold [Flavobacterium succinicans]